MNRSLAVFLALAMLLAHVLAIQTDGEGNFAFPHDQAYAAFEFARNALIDGSLRWSESGGGPEGYPSWIWLWIACLGERLTNHVNLFCQTVGILCGLGSVYALSRVRPTRIAGLIAPLCFVCSGIAATACGSGTELALFTFAAILVFLSAERDWPWRLTLALLVLSTARFEGLFAAALFLIVYAPKLYSRGLRRGLAPFAGALLGAAVYAYATRHSIDPWLPLRGVWQPLPGQWSEGLETVWELLRTTSVPLLLFFPLGVLAVGRLSGMGARALLLAVLFTLLTVSQGRSPLVFSQAFGLALPFVYLAVQEGLVVALDARSLVRRVAIVCFALALFSTGLASRSAVNLGPLPLGTWQASWMAPSASARAGYRAPLARAGLQEELELTERLRSVGLYMRMQLPPESQVLSAWPGALAYVSRLDVQDLLGRTNPLPYAAERGLWTRRSHADVEIALQQRFPVVVPRIARAEQVPTPAELASEWVREFDTQALSPERVALIEGYFKEYALLTVPVQAYVRALVARKHEPFQLLFLRSQAQLPRLSLVEEGGFLRVACEHNARELLADLVLRVTMENGELLWVAPHGGAQTQRLVARAGLLIGNSGAKQFELLRWPIPAQALRIEAELENPSYVGAEDNPYRRVGETAVWQR